MKRLYIIILMAALLTACGHRASKDQKISSNDTAGLVTVQDDELLTEAPFAVDSIGLEREDTIASVQISVHWPVAGPVALVNSIRQYICRELTNSPLQEDKSEVKLYNDGKTAVETTVDRQYQELYRQKKEAFEDGFGYGIPYMYSLHISKLEESDTYVSYIANSEGFLGGAHGFATSTGITFRKSDGMQLGYQSEYNKEKETYERTAQTLFINPDSPQLAALLKEGIRNYFQEYDQEVMTDEQLKDMLIGVEDIDRIPLPNTAPIFTSRGLNFTYQQYEIAPYAAGMINFSIAYDKVRPFLTDEAAEVIK